MDEAIEDLVLAPFQDIVAQGRIARGHAEDASNDGMRVVAQSLVKEGERALKRLEPLCRKKYEESGLAFVNALKDDVEISQFIEELNDLLYDFEEFVDVDNFDAEKFLDLQACSRKAAPGISHRITRLKLLPQGEEEPGTTSSPASPFGPTVLVRQPSDEVSLHRGHGQPLPYPEDTDRESQVKYSMPWPSGQDIEARQAESAVAQVLPPVQEEPSPPPTRLLDSWSQRSQDIEKGLEQGLELVAQRREHTTYSDSVIGSEANSEHAYSPNISGQPKPPQPAVPPKSPNRIVAPSMLGPSLERTPSVVKAHHGRESVSPISSRLNRDSVASSANTSIRSSTPDHRTRERDSYFDVVSPISPTHRTSEYSVESQFQGLNQGQSPHVRPLFSQANSSPSTAQASKCMEPMVLPAPGMIPDGLMPVEEDATQPLWPLEAPEMQLGGCAISLQSSYYHFGGFCKGAVEIIQGGLGIKHIKKQGLSVGNIEVAKCKACAYELEWKAVQRDLNNEGTENFKSESIGFRLRFLSKSHIHSRNIGEQIYGCLLCIQLGRTSHPNDATVFFGQRQLFAHLSRHPRPLQHVPGLTVVESEELPRQFANNYDLHFSEVPRASNLAPMMRDLTALPTATALQTCRPSSQSNAMKRPADGGRILLYAAGARILGIQFPEKYQGAWCVGWADHERGLISADAIRLELPRKDNSREQGSSSMQAVTRWKFAVKDSKETKGGGEWLSFSKGEVLTNIGWSHQDHWCWSGTNSKGRSGLFPRSHIEPCTLMEVVTKSDCVSVASNERKTGLLSRISMRHRSGSGGGGEGGSSSTRASIC